MELKELITRRKSTRSYTGVPVEDETIRKIEEFSASLTPLYPELGVRSEITDSKNVRCILPWTTPQVISFFSEETEDALVNVGFLYQQLELYIQSLGLGACWLGMGRLNSKGQELLQSKDNLHFAIMMAFGYPKGAALREGPAEFKRKALEEISDRKDERLEPARLAPSSVNSQPWYFVHDGDKIHAYCALFGIMKKKPSDMNLIDMGIALAQLYLSNPETFQFFKEEQPAQRKNYTYIGSFRL